MAVPNVDELTNDEVIKTAIACLTRLPIDDVFTVVNESLSDEDLDELALRLNEVEGEDDEDGEAPVGGK